MSALSTAAGRAFDRNSLNHAVCHLEQLITTGGGWQDQVKALQSGLSVTSGVLTCLSCYRLEGC